MSAKAAFNPFRSLYHGWEALKRVPLPLIVGGFLLNFSPGSGCSSGTDLEELLEGVQGLEGFDEGFDYNYSLGLDALQQASLLSSDPFGDLLAAGAGMIVGLLCFAVVAAVLLFALRAFLLPGWYRLHEETLRTSTSSFGTLFSGKDLFLDMALWLLLKGLIQLGMLVVCLIPVGLMALLGLGMGMIWITIIGGLMSCALMVVASLYVLPGLAYGGEAIALDGLGVMDALGRSWDIARGNRGWILLFFYVIAAVQVALALTGVIFCVLGVLFTGAAAAGMAAVAHTEAYLVYTRGEREADGWTLVPGRGGSAPVGETPAVTSDPGDL